jgi:DNA topoisomerase I
MALMNEAPTKAEFEDRKLGDNKSSSSIRSVLKSGDSRVEPIEDLPPGLRYVTDAQPGFSRRRVGRKGFYYLDEKRDRIRSETVIERIRSLVIPPAWEGVWICRYSNGHLQVTGRDARDRKQYKYHPKWTEVRNETKFQKLALFAEKLPLIKDQTEAHLRLKDLPKEKVLAAVVRVMDLTRIRIGNDIYAQENDSYGLTTMRNEHAEVDGTKVRFQFRGKSGVERDLSFRDRRLSHIIRQCQELPGEELFCYEDERGEVHDIGSSDVNEYLRAITGDALTAKDFRTWGGTVKAMQILAQMGQADDLPEAARKKRELEVIKKVAKYLGNTVAVCRKYYVHPAIFEADRDGLLHRKVKALKAPPGEHDEASLKLTLEILNRR